MLARFLARDLASVDGDRNGAFQNQIKISVRRPLLDEILSRWHLFQLQTLRDNYCQVLVADQRLRDQRVDQMLSSVRTLKLFQQRFSRIHLPAAPPASL